MILLSNFSERLSDQPTVTLQSISGLQNPTSHYRSHSQPSHHVLNIIKFSLKYVWWFPIPYTHVVVCPWDSPGKNTGVGCHFLQDFLISPKTSTRPSPWWIPSPPLTWSSNCMWQLMTPAFMKHLHSVSGTSPSSTSLATPSQFLLLIISLPFPDPQISGSKAQSSSLVPLRTFSLAYLSISVEICGCVPSLYHKLG